MADRKPLTRRYRVSFAVLNRVNLTISINTTPITVQGYINCTALASAEEMIAQEWYLHHMGDTKFVPESTAAKANPLEDFQFTITGMVALECDEDGNLEQWLMG